MATVTKDFKVKNGIKVQGDANIDASLYVGGPNATVNGSDIITEDIITGGTQTNIAVTYNPSTKTLDFVAENGVADSTTSDLAEGTNLYFTESRVYSSLGQATGSPILYNGMGSFDLELGTDSSINLDPANNGIQVNRSVVDAWYEPAGAIDSLTTSDIEEGTNLYFTAQRAIDAVGGSASSENIPGTVVKRDSNGSFAAEDITAADITADSYTFTGGSASITNGSLGMAIFAAQGDITLGAMTGEVQIGGAQVTTESNTQTLTNKTIGDVLTFNDGANTSTIDVAANDLIITANDNLTLGSSTGDVVLNPGSGIAYIGATVVGNEIATHSYVDNAVAGLAWKESAHLLLVTTEPLTTTGATGTLVIDGHAALDQSDNGYRILVIDSTSSGIYDYSDDGTTWTLTRSSDADTASELVGAAIFIMEGTQYNATSWVQSNHYLTDFSGQVWTQFSGTGNYTAGFGINLIGREFSADTTEMATSEALGNAVADLTDYVDGFLNSTDGTVIEYIDDQDAATLLAANGYSDTLVATGDATATPTYQAIDINYVAKQVAATASGLATVPTTIYSFQNSEYRSAEFLVKLAYFTHTELSRVVLTLDTLGNIAISEYAIVGTNGSLSEITASVNVATGLVELKVTPGNDSTITVVGTLLV